MEFNLVGFLRVAVAAFSLMGHWRAPPPDWQIFARDTINYWALTRCSAATCGAAEAPHCPSTKPRSAACCTLPSAVRSTASRSSICRWYLKRANCRSNATPAPIPPPAWVGQALLQLAPARCDLLSRPSPCRSECAGQHHCCTFRPASCAVRR